MLGNDFPVDNFPVRRKLLILESFKHFVTAKFNVAKFYKRRSEALVMQLDT